MNIDIFNYHRIHPLESLGLVDAFWTIHIDTIIYTWAAMLLFFSLVFVARLALKKGPCRILVLCEAIVNFFMQTITESFGRFEFRYFSFISSIFFFTLFCCLIGLFPFLDEATKDLNTTFALGLSSFCYVQYQKIRVLGLREFFKEFLQPIFIMLPINVVGELAKIVSMSFRLFGNILGGGIVFAMLIDFLQGYANYFFILLIVYFVLHTAMKYLSFFPTSGVVVTLIDILSVLIFIPIWAQLFFGVFEGMIQSFVIMMLTLTYLSMGISHHNEQNHQAVD